MTERRSFEEDGSFRARLATFGETFGNHDVLTPGAFVSRSADVRVTMADNLDEPIGRAIVEMDARGVVASGRIVLNARTAPLREIASMGVDWGIGYDVIESRAPTDEERGRGADRVVESVEIFSVSAYPKATR